jgi:hypothetical protein
MTGLPSRLGPAFVPGRPRARPACSTCLIYRFTLAWTPRPWELALWLAQGRVLSLNARAPSIGDRQVALALPLARGALQAPVAPAQPPVMRHDALRGWPLRHGPSPGQEQAPHVPGDARTPPRAAHRARNRSRGPWAWDNDFCMPVSVPARAGAVLNVSMARDNPLVARCDFRPLAALPCSSARAVRHSVIIVSRFHPSAQPLAQPLARRSRPAPKLGYGRPRDPTATHGGLPAWPGKPPSSGLDRPKLAPRVGFSAWPSHPGGL